MEMPSTFQHKSADVASDAGRPHSDGGAPDELARIEQESSEQMRRSQRAHRISLLLGVSLGLVLITWALIAPRLGDRGQLTFGLLVAFEATAMGFILAMYSRQTYVRVAERNFDRLRGLAGRLREASIRDSLTGLYNHGHFLSALEEQISRARATEHTFSVAILDLDEFKSVNDRHGHLVGNQTLKLIAAAIQEHVREQDLVARYGGDEFCLILPDTDEAGAEALVQELRAAVGELSGRLEAAGGLITFGSGVASFPEDGTNVHTLIAAADARLYREKQRSRLLRAEAGDALVQELFHRIGEVVSRSSDPSERLSSLTEVVCESLNLRGAILYSHEEERLKHIARFFSDQELEQALMGVIAQGPVRADELLSEEAKAEKRVVTVEELTVENGIPDRFAGVLPRGMWSQWTPISVADHAPAGLLLIGMKGEASPPEPGLAIALGRLIGVAIQNNIGSQAAQQQHVRLQALADIGSLLLRSGSFEERLRQAAQRVVDAAGCDAVTILTQDPNGQKPILTSTFAPNADGLVKEWERHFREQHEQFLQQLKEGSAALREPLIIDEPAEHPIILPFLQDVYRRGGIRSLLILPLPFEQESLGALAVLSTRREAFDTDTVALFSTIASQIANSTQVAILLQKVSASYEQLRQSHIDAMLSLAAVAEARDPLTGGHLHRLRAYTEAIARRLGRDESEVATLGYAAVVHDIGKLRIPDELVAKPGSLTEEEWDLIRLHPIYGEEVLGQNGAFEEARQVARSHHERWDGTGYPDGLRGDEIPFGARLVSVGDVFDALTTDRPYKAAWSIDEAVAYIRDERGRQFAPEIVDAFLALVDDGTLTAITGEGALTPDRSVEGDAEQKAA